MTGVERMMLSTEEAAEVLGCTPKSIRSWLAEGKLVGKKIGGRWFVNKADFESRTGLGELGKVGQNE